MSVQQKGLKGVAEPIGPAEHQPSYRLSDKSRRLSAAGRFTAPRVLMSIAYRQVSLQGAGGIGNDLSINLGAHEMCIRACTAKSRASGFTLIELMVVVAIVAILAAVAYPSYLSYMVRNNRAVAQSALMDIALRQQQYLLDKRAYAPDVTSLNVTLSTNVTQRYTVAIASLAGPPPTFTVTATPIAGTKQAADGDLSIDQAGTKTPASKW